MLEDSLRARLLLLPPGGGWQGLCWRGAQIMSVDYGFRSGSMRLYQEEYGSVPSNVFRLVGPLPLSAAVRMQLSVIAARL